MILLDVVLGTLSGDIWLALALYFAILVFGWAKGKLGDLKAAVIFVLILVLIILNHTDLIWVIVGVYLFITYGKQIFKV